jgi:hypothetical protein
MAPAWSYQGNGVSSSFTSLQTPSQACTATGALGEALILGISRHNAPAGAIALAGPAVVASLSTADVTMVDVNGDYTQLYSVMTTGAGAITASFASGQGAEIFALTMGGMFSDNGVSVKVDATVGATGNSASAASGNTSIGQNANDLAVGFIMNFQDVLPWTVGAGWTTDTFLSQTISGGGILEWQDAPGPASPSATATRVGSQGWTAVCLLYYTLANYRPWWQWPNA